MEGCEDVPIVLAVGQFLLSHQVTCNHNTNIVSYCSHHHYLSLWCMQYSTRASLIGSESGEQELGGILLPLDWLDNSVSKSVRVCVCSVGVVNTMRGCYSRALQTQSTQYTALPSPWSIN